MLKSFTEPRIGSGDAAGDKNGTPTPSSNTADMFFSQRSSTEQAPNGSTPVIDDRDKYKRRIAAMISGVSSELADRRSYHHQTHHHHHQQHQQQQQQQQHQQFERLNTAPTDIRLMKTKAASMFTPSLSQSDLDLSGSLPSFRNDTSSGHSRSSSQSGSMCNLLGTSSTLGGSQSSLSLSFKSDVTPQVVASASSTPTPMISSNATINVSSNANNNTPIHSAVTTSNSGGNSTPSTRQFRVNLAALLNDPRPGKRPVNVFSKHYGEAFERAASMPIPPLPGPAYNNPASRDFKKYLKAIKKRSSQHHKSDDTSSIASSSVQRPSSPTSQDLSTVPPEFFQSTFSLSNPDTFYSLFSWLKSNSNKSTLASTSSGSDLGETSSPSPSSSSKLHPSQSAQSHMLHDRLSMYLDVVEAEISRQVSSRSDSFFATMTSQDVLQDYMSQTLVAVRSLRTKLKNVHSSFVENPMKVMRLTSTRSNHIAVYKKLRLISTVAGTQSTIQILLSSGDYSGAIDLIKTTQEVIGEDLNGIVAFRYLPVQLAEVERTIDTMLCDEIKDCLSRELNRPLPQQSTADQNSSAPVVINLVDEARLVGIALGLLKLNRFVFLEALQEEAGNSIKTIVKSCVIHAISTSETLAANRSNNAPMDDQLRLLAPTEWLALVQTMFANLTAHIDRVQAIRSILMELILLAAGKQQTTAQLTSSERHPSTTLMVAAEDSANLRLPETSFLKLKAQFIDLAYAVSDFAQQRCIKVLTIRHQQRNGVSSDRVSVNDFLSFMLLSEKFTARLAEFLERPTRTLPAGSPLPAFVHCQMARFIQQFHEERRHKLAEILDTEMWKPAVVPSDFQKLLDTVSESKRLVLLPSSPSAESTASGASDVAVSTPSKAIRVGDEEYCVAGTSLMLLRLIVDYGDCATRIPSAAGDLLNKLVELLKTFNSRTCQLVLGAGAVQLLGLRTITAGHLALSARSLQFVLCLLPLVRSHFSAILSSEPSTSSVPLAKYIDQLEHDYADHVNEIVNKILSVVDGAISEQFGNWEAKPPVPSPLVKTVCGQLKRLHESVANITPTPARAEMFRKVSASFREQMINRLRQLEIKLETNTSACGIVSQEIAFFNEQMRSFSLGLDRLSIGDFMTNSQNKRP